MYSIKLFFSFKYTHRLEKRRNWQCDSTAQKVWVSTESVVVSQGVGVSVWVVIGSDNRSYRVDDLGSGGTNASQSDGCQEKDLKREQIIKLIISVKYV